MDVDHRAHNPVDRREVPRPAESRISEPRNASDRVVVEQAVGVLAQRGKLSVDGAFDRLDRYARHFQVRLADLAREVLDTDLAAVDVLTVRAGKTLHHSDTGV